MAYLWEIGVEKKEFDSLSGDIEADILVVGGGMAGILVAYFLRNEGYNPVVVEADRIGNGATRGTTAVLSAQHDIPYTSLAKIQSEEYAKKYLEANLWAVEKFREMAKNIDCDFEEAPSYMYSVNDREKMQQEVEFINSLGYKAEFADKIPLSFEVAGAVKFPNMAQFHPLKFLQAIAKDLTIYENTRVTKIKGNVAYTDNGKITAKKIIITTHFPIVDMYGLYFAKMYQDKSYVLAIEHKNIGATLISDEENGYYFRSYGDLLLIGGGDHRTGFSGGGYSEVEDFVSTYFKDSKVKYAWSNQDCVTLDNTAYIGKYSKFMDNVYVATGFNLWGMTTSMLAGKILADMISGRENEYQEIFCPHRSMMRKQLFINMSVYGANLLCPMPKRCKHMGSRLKWNKKEHMYECPCHGTCYNADGEIVFEPTTKKMKGNK